MARDQLASKYQSIAKNATTEKDEIGKRKAFSTREVGLTHPDNSSFIRLTDAGDIEIFAAPGVGLVISGSTRMISIFADTIRFHSKEDGLKWNSMDFNYVADNFSEPTFIKSNNESIKEPIFEKLIIVIVSDKQSIINFNDDLASQS